MKKHVTEMPSINGQGVAEIGDVEAPGMNFRHAGPESIYTDSHADGAHFTDIVLLHQILKVSGTWPEAALQANDVANALGFGQSQQFLRLGRGGR